MGKCALYDHLKALIASTVAVPVLSLALFDPRNIGPATLSWLLTPSTVQPHTSTVVPNAKQTSYWAPQVGASLFIRYKYKILIIPASDASQRISDPRGFLNDSANLKNVSASRTVSRAVVKEEGIIDSAGSKGSRGALFCISSASCAIRCSV